MGGCARRWQVAPHMEAQATFLPHPKILRLVARNNEQIDVPTALLELSAVISSDSYSADELKALLVEAIPEYTPFTDCRRDSPRTIVQFSSSLVPELASFAG